MTKSSKTDGKRPASDAADRIPVFYFADAREARQFGQWIDENFEAVKKAAEATTQVGKLQRIERYAVGAMQYLRFDFSTGDAAGQNMVGRATLAACEWIRSHFPRSVHYLLSGNIDTDKKHSHLNVIQSRGKRVIAEAIIPDKVVRRLMGVDTGTLFRLRQLSNVGALLSGAVNNGAHAANAIAAIFLAATVLAGETSLSCAVIAGDWVSSHEQFGRNRD